MDFEDFLDAAQAAHKSGRDAAKRGLWYVAMYEYGRVLGMLDMMAMLQDAGHIKISPQQEKALAALIGSIETEYEKAILLAGNGHPKENPAPGFSDALDRMREDLDEIFS